jgi:hypothetical protein
VKSQSIEILLKDLLRITTKETHKLSEILADNFDFFGEQIVKILREEYQKPKNDYKALCGCFSVIWKVSQKQSRIGNKTFRNSYPLINKGLQDKRVSVKRFATLSVLNIICKIYLERRFCKLSSNEDNDKEINAEIRELKKNIRSAVFLESFSLTHLHQMDKRTSCERAGIKEEVLVDVSRSVLG